MERRRLSGLNRGKYFRCSSRVRSSHNVNIYLYSWIPVALLTKFSCRCQCSPTHDCVYDRPDMKMRVYRHNCMPKDAIKNRTQKQTTSVTHQRHNINGRHHTQQYHAHRRPAAELDTPRDLSAENEQQRQQSSTQPQQPYLKHKLQRPQMSEKQLTTLADVASTYLAWNVKVRSDVYRFTHVTSRWLRRKKCFVSTFCFFNKKDPSQKPWQKWQHTYITNDVYNSVRISLYRF